MKTYSRAASWSVLGGLLMLAVACGITVPHPTPVPPPAPHKPYVVQVQVTPDGALQEMGEISLEVDPPFGAQPECQIEGVALTCRLNDNVTPPYGAHLNIDIDTYQPYHTDFVLQGWVETPDSELLTLTPIVLEPVEPPMPPAPSKQALMEAQYTFQGLRASCPEYDPRPIPIFDPMLDVVDVDCKNAILQAHRDAGDKVVGVAISHRYNEPGVIPILQAGHDWTGDLPGLHAFLVDLIRQGFYPQLHLAMDGHSIKALSGNYVYNDPVGWTYGCEWGAEFFPQLADALDDIHQYIRFLPGYDGVFYGCEDNGQPIKIPAFSKQFKARWPDGVLGIEFNTGHLPFGEGDSDWQPNGRMWLFDLVFAEFDSNLDQDSAWQIIARLQKRQGDYHRPPEQPAGDDPNPPAYLRNWPGNAVCFEWDTYFDVRFQTTPQSVAAKRAKLRAMGCPYVG